MFYILFVAYKKVIDPVVGMRFRGNDTRMYGVMWCGRRYRISPTLAGYPTGAGSRDRFRSCRD